MKYSEQGIAKLAAALTAAQNDLPAIAKDATNPHFKSRFASLGAIIEAVRPVLAKHKLAIVQGATLPESDANAKVTGFSVETMLVHESGEWICATLPVPLAKADPQGAGAAMTYGRRYGLSALLSLNTDEDDDGNSQRSGGRGTGGGQSAPRQERSTSDIGSHAPRNTSGTTQATPLPGPEFLMPIGKNRGKRIGDLDTETLAGVAEWVNEKQFQKKHADLLIAIANVLKSREAA